MQKYWISNSSKALPSTILLRFSIIHTSMKTNIIPKENCGFLFLKKKLGNDFVAAKHTGNLQKDRTS